jgi:hypothetical protein
VESGARVRRVVLDAWPLLLAILLVLPLLLHPGHPLARDLVFVPHQPWTDASLGLGGGAPRAVPLDTVVSALTAHLLDGGLLARVAIPLILALAGWGAHRLVGELGFVARLAAGGFAVWNPYVVERLALGQWALLASYAALPWLLVSARRYRRLGGRADLGATVAWLGLASLTPTGGLLGSAAALVAGSGRRWRRTAVLAGACLLLQLTWLVPSFLASGALTSDPRAVRAFSADAEGPGGVLAAVLGLGGIWDRTSVPVTRGSWWTLATAVVVVVVLAAGWRVLARLWGRGDLARVAGFAVAGLGLALLTSVPAGEHLVRWLVEQVPGAGLLRDSQKFLAPWAVLVTAAIAATVDRVCVAATRAGAELVVGVALAAAGLPFMLLPDGAAAVWPTVDPVTYPPAMARAAADVDADPGTLVTLPWRSYRRFDWGNGETSSDPAVRWFDTDVLTSDGLQVGSTLLRGESERARSLGRALRREPTVEALRNAGARWALVYRDDPAAPDLDLRGLDLVYGDRYLGLYAVPGAHASAGPSAGQRWSVIAVQISALAAVLIGACIAVSEVLRSHRRSARLRTDKRESI